MQNNHKINSLTSTGEATQGTRRSKGSAIGELILPDLPQLSCHFLTPVINGLANHHEQRWLTLILPKQDKQSSLNGVRLSGNNIQVLNHHTTDESITLTEQALASGTSHTVISWLGQLDSSDLNKLEQAAHHGNCQGLAIRRRQHISS